MRAEGAPCRRDGARRRLPADLVRAGQPELDDDRILGVVDGDDLVVLIGKRLARDLK